MLRQALIGCCLSATTWCFGQSDTTDLNEVLFSGTDKNELSYIHLNQSKIDRKLAADIGSILMFLPGLQIRTYGDVNGLKTAGFRSLGAAHTSIVIDNQLQPVTQSGSVDLSAIPAEFVHNIQLIRQDCTNDELPIQSKLTGNLIQLTTLHQQSNLKNTFNFSYQNGSFGYNAINISGTYKLTKKFSMSVNSRARTYTGNFPFEYLNGNTIVRENRQNNALKDLLGSLGLKYIINENHSLVFKGSYFNSAKELSGAVVFYNANNQQFLNAEELNFHLAHRFTKNRMHWSSQANFQQGETQYIDSNYLNSQGYLDQIYTSQYLNGQSQMSYSVNEKITLNLGSEVSHETVLSGVIDGQPTRLTLNNLIAGKYRGKLQELQLQLGIQEVQNDSEEGLRKQLNYLPALQYIVGIKNWFLFGVNARYAVRQATFSELYYQRIGGANLKPEEATVIAVPLKFNTQLKSWYNAFRIEPFYTHAENKILAVPTKNLFVWSIQNIGKSQSAGIEVYNESRIKIKNHWLGQTISFTYQEAIDLTDPNSTVYRNQLTYIPFTSGNAELDFSSRNWSVFVNFMGQGYRYALPENLSNSIVNGYYTIDIGGSYKLQLKQQQLKLNIAIKNVTNQYNQYIRYFVLPGINYQLKLTYAL